MHKTNNNKATDANYAIPLHRNQSRTVPLIIYELSTGPGFADWSPTEPLFQSSNPTYDFHCLNHLASNRYLQYKANDYCKINGNNSTSKVLFYMIFPDFT